VVDEAAAKLRTEIDSMPAELDERLRRQMQLEIEREALKKESDKASRERLGKIEKELAELKTETAACRRSGKPIRKFSRSSAICGLDRTGEGRDRAGGEGLRPEQSRRAEVREVDGSGKAA